MRGRTKQDVKSCETACRMAEVGRGVDLLISMFTFSFLFRRKKKKQNRKRKTRMIKWLESSGASAPEPHSKSEQSY